MKLLGNVVLLEPLPKKDRSPAGVWFPMDPRWRDDDSQWRVLAVGPGRTIRKKGKAEITIPIELEPGDHIVTFQIHGNKAKLPNGNIIIEADEIIAKWKPNAS